MFPSKLSIALAVCFMYIKKKSSDHCTIFFFICAQMGTVVDEGTDFYSSRLTKKQRKQTLVEELMADANIRQYVKTFIVLPIFDISKQHAERQYSYFDLQRHLLKYSVHFKMVP